MLSLNVWRLLLVYIWISSKWISERNVNITKHYQHSLNVSFNHIQTPKTMYLVFIKE